MSNDLGSFKGSEDLLKMSKLIKCVYAPMERTNPNVSSFLYNYTKTVRDSIEQLTGSRAIDIPTSLEPEEMVKHNPDILHKYGEYLTTWANKIKEKLSEVKSMNQDKKQAIDIIDYWRAKSSILSTLYQDLNKPIVQAIKKRVSDNRSMDSFLETAYNDFEEALKLLVTDNGEAKDNSKFLNNLERQFKILQAGDLANIDQCISSLLNGLRLVFIISRYYKIEENMSRLLAVIANEICDRVKERVNIKELLKPKPDRIYEEQLVEVGLIIAQGKKVLKSWDDTYIQTKNTLENEQSERWDFGTQEILKRAKDMGVILGNFQTITLQLEKLLELLGPKLKSVAGSTERLDQLVKKAKNLIRPIEDFPQDFFAKEAQELWRKTFQKFNQESEGIQREATKLIEDTFKVLRSSESGFEFLQKFKVESLDEVEQNLQMRYGDVLDNYSLELRNNKEIFERGQGKTILTKNRPPIAGAIAWKKSILRRVKAPIVRFITKENMFKPKEFADIKEQYKSFFDALDKFEMDQYTAWVNKVDSKVGDFLKERILKINKEGQFEVNFPEDFKVLISEAKYLDRMMPNIPKKVLNIALQEEEYFRYIDRIEKMLREYNNTINSLKDVEKELMKEHLNNLRSVIEPGTTDYFLNSLGIIEFISKCSTEIKQFNDKKNRVEEKTRNIEDIIKTIEDAKIIKDYDFKSLSLKQKDLQNYPTLQDFVQHFEKYMNQQVESLAEKYSKIGISMLPNIAMAVFDTKGENNKVPKMRIYYYYWERRVYNALVKMIVRALITYKTLLRRPRKNNIPSPSIPLFKVVAEFTNQVVTINPIHKEITTTLESLRDSIIKTAAWFPRWKDGTCILVEKPNSDKGFEERGKEYTFAEEMDKNKVVTDVCLEINDAIAHAIDRVKKLQGKWEITEEEQADDLENESIVDSHRRGLFNPKHKIKVDKLLEKNPMTLSFEVNLDVFHMLLKEYESASNEADADFIKVDFTKVRKIFESQAKERIKKIASTLIKIVDKEYEELRKTIFEYYNEIRRDEENRDQVKKCLNTLTKIRDSTEDKEFEIAELGEKCRLLRKYESYGIDFDAKKYEECMNLGKYWNKLLSKAKDKHDNIKGSLVIFEKQTQSEVQKLQEKIDKLYDMYIKTGPSAIDISLTSGVDKMHYFRKEVDELNLSRSETVKMQKLFGMEISSFPKLVEIDEELKKLDPMYVFYDKISKIIGELSQKQWDKFEYKEIDEARKMFKAKIREFGKNDVIKNTTVYKKLEAAQQEFEKPLTIIENLKSSLHFKDSHWERLFKLIDKPTAGVVFSQITLKQVLNLNLYEYQDKVEEIRAAANTEFNNKNSLLLIEEFWRTANFEVSDHKKGAFKVKVSDEIKVMLDDHLNTLQAIESSKFAGVQLKLEVRKWMDNLVKIQDTIDEWIKVQTKWLYLEGIYIGNEDIRSQLSKETKTFEQHHKTFKNLNEKVSKNTNIFANCVLNDTTLNQLKELSKALDKSQKSLTDYLNSKKKIFPRFYFISDEDLLSILGSSDVATIQSQMLKLFDNVKALEFEKGKVVKMISDENESFPFTEPYKPDGPVEIWMTKVDEIMIDTLRKLTKEGVFNYAKMDRTEWMAKYICMIVLVTRQIWWTWRVEDVFRKVKEGDKYAMKKEATLQTQELNFLIGLVQSELEVNIDPSGRFRRKINNLIIVDVHARDIVDRFVRDSILDAREFDWESQLRFYWRNNINDIQIDQCTGHFRYGYEYQGLTTRLVITPLTDRCVMTLTTALTFFLGGAPAGPAGTGKTETTKDLGKNLAIRAVVTNCGDNFDVFAMGTNYSGLCQTGFWGVFDEFNRILPEVLSVVSTQIGDIQRALAQGKNTVELMKEEINLKHTVGIFVTMNPGYEGRSELPDNLKALFRPVTMIVPDLNIICENMLMSEGFEGARMLSKKMTVLYKLSREQLSKQYHYDFGLRALKSVLVMAGSLKRGSPDIDEEDVLMRALKDMNMPKFVHEDVGLFEGLLSDLFPGKKVDGISHKEFNQRILECQVKKGLQELQDQALKVIQLYETMETRHTTMVVGPTGAGKTTVIDLLKESRTIPNVRNVVYYIINPKAQGNAELYGVLDPQTRDWKDGILSKTFKFANEDFQEKGPTEKGPKEELRWILFDGDVDAVWVENMNSVMDDNKLLTLSNGDRIRLKAFCKLLFEVFDLQYASPATISRCGMVYVDPKNFEYIHYFNSWRDRHIADKENKEPLLEMFNELYGKYITPCVDRVFDGIKDESGTSEGAFELSISRTKLNLVQQFTNIMDCMLPEDINTLATDPNRLENMFIYSCAWSFGSCIKTEKDSESFSKYLKGLPSIVIPDKNIFDYTFEGSSWVPVKSRVTAYVPPPDGDFNKILVPTADTVKFNHLLSLLMKNFKPTLLVGEPGTAKTVIIKSYLNSLKIDSYTVLSMNFSSRTGSMEVQRNIESVTDKRRQGIYAPKGNKKLVIFVDDLHMPNVDKYGTQQPIALLKFLIDKKLMYERGGSLEKREYRDCQYVAALLPPGGGYNTVDPRFLSLFNCISVQFPKEENIKTIYNSILIEHFKPFPKEFEELAKDLTSATYKLYQRIIEALPRSPIKFHYIFNLRDLSKVYQGILRSKPNIFNTKEKIIKLWKHECLRVFVDRLVDETDKKIVEKEIINDLIKETFGEDMQKKVIEGDLIFSDIRDTQPLEQDYEDPKIYQSLESYGKSRAKCEELLGMYNEENAEMPLVLFNDAVEHLLRLIRVLRFPRGNSMLVGYGGSGKQSLTKLATFICSYQLYSITLKKNYGETAFRGDLLEFYTTKLAEKPQVFMITDTQIIEESFLELINTMLTVGVINNLFDQATRSKMNTEITAKLNKTGSADEMWEIVCDYFRKSLHIVLCMSPAGDSLRVRCRNFPGLISNTTIDWFFPWPEDALRNVAEVNLKELNFEPELFSKVVEHFVFVHTQIPTIATRYELSTRRKVFNTPKNYLDFLKTYMASLEKNKNEYRVIIVDFEKGLDKLKDAKIQVTEMSKEIEADRLIVEERKDLVSKITADIKQKQIVANEQSAAAKEKETVLTVKNEDIYQKKKEAEELFEKNKPLLDAAKKKVSEIDKGALTFAASLPNPPAAIMEIGKLLQILKVNSKCDPVGLGWPTCQAALREGTILSDLADYDIENAKPNQIHNASKQVEHIRKTQGEAGIAKQGAAIEKLFTWALSTIDLYSTFVQIRELKNKVRVLTEEQKILTDDLNKTKKIIQELNDSLAELGVKLTANEKELKELKKKFDEMNAKLNNARRLLDGLAAEEERWTIEKEDKKVKIQYLEGECLLCASFLSYYGPFDQEFRKEMTETFKKNIRTIKPRLPPKEEGAPAAPEDQKEESERKMGILIGETFDVKDLLTTDVQITKWNSEGLPSDELSIQNGILTTQATRYPLCIDPQLQAIKWIKKKERNITKFTTNFNDPDLIRKLELAFKEREAILIENVGQDIDPIIDDILLKKYTTVGGVQKVNIGTTQVDVPVGKTDSEFIIYMTTKLPNPTYTPEIMGKTNVINYSVNINGLAEQLLSEVIKNENPQQEQDRINLINETSEGMQIQNSLQKKILESLVNSKKDIIQDIDLIENLQSSKTKSKEIGLNLIEANKKKAFLEASRQDYMPVAKRGAILFFCMQKMSAISDMYQYSLSSYLEVFKRSLTDSTKDDVVVTRIKIIIEKLTQNVYDYVTLGIFKNHRRLFTFQMVIMIQEGEGNLNRKELDFFLKGNTKLGNSKEGRVISWLTESNCKDIESLVEVGEIWKNFYSELRASEDEWKRWFDLENPEENPLPPPYKDLIKTRFQLLLILRVMRPDRISLGIDKLITEFFGSDHYIRVPVMKDKWLLGQTSSTIPIIFILSPGADPSTYIRTLANNEGFTNKKFLPLSLGQGMEETAYEYVANASQRGYWVLLQNCDLLPSCIKTLEKRMEAYTGALSPDFRLWMTTQPTKEFPLGILQRALKIVTEPPAGIKNNMEDVINRISEESVKTCTHYAYKPLTYVLVFMHAVILDRAKYGKIGWNITYDFNFSDFQISYRLLNLYLNKSLENKEDTIPWDSLKYLIGEAMYGGRVTDEFDRRTLMTYLDEYMGDFLFDKNHEFFFAESANYKYRLPNFVDKQGLAVAASALPNADSPVVFGLHTNAEITYYTNDAKNLWINFLKMESVGNSSISPAERDRKIEEIAKDLLEKTTFEMDPAVLRSARIAANNELKPTEVVLYQEMDRFKNLSNKIQSTLSNLLRALSGKIGMNAELDDLAVSLYNSFLPASWAKLAPSTEKKLGSWINHFLNRRTQYTRWQENGEPAVMWLSGLHIPESYLTALVQDTCRKKGWALDKSTLFTDMTTFDNPSQITKKPEFGCYISGLSLEGISWDMQRNCLRAQLPKELMFAMPIIKIVPEESSKLKLKDRMKIPVYVTQNRRNAKGVGHVFDADLETTEHPSHWILQGAALVLNTDE